MTLEEADTKPPKPKKAKGTGYFSLRGRQQRLIDRYIGLQNGAEAIRQEGYRGTRADQAWYRFTQKPGIKEAIEERTKVVLAEIGVNEYRTMQEVARVAYQNPKRLLDANGNLLPMKDWPDDAAATVIGFDHEELFSGQGENRTRVGIVLKPRFANKNDALKLLMQHQKLLVEKHELTGKDGQQLPTGPTFIIERKEAEAIGADLDDKV